jgi:tagaturonate reductase
MKMRVRVVPSIASYAETHGRAPDSLAFGFAAYLLFMRGELQARRSAAGAAVPADDQGERVRSLWSASPGEDDASLAALARAACSDAALWGRDLSALPGLVDAVTSHLTRLVRVGPEAALQAHLSAARPA